MTIRIRRLLFILSTLALAAAPFAHAADFKAATTLDDNLDHIVKIWCGYYNDLGQPEVYSQGSGIILEDNLVLTNSHVVFYLDEFDESTFYYYDFCAGGLAPNSYTEPESQFWLDYEAFNWNADFDYAFMQAFDSEQYVPWNFESGVSYGNPDSLVHGDDLTLIGYPAAGGSTITSTFGSVAGFENATWIKTDAVAEFGSSGGGAFDSLGNLIGIPTLISAGELNSFTFIQNINAIIEDAFPRGTITRDYENLYTQENEVCFSIGDCYNYGEGEELQLGDELEDPEMEPETAPPVIDKEPDAILEEEPEPEAEAIEDEPVISLGSEIEEGRFEEARRDQALIDRLTGQILLQADLHGEAWYVNPDDGLRYYMRDGAVAYQMMRMFGLGITNADLETIPAVDSTDEMLELDSVCSTNSLARRLKGDILLQVEEHGEAWWIHPDKCYRIYLKDGDEAYQIMRYLSLGILSDDLAKMPTGDIR